MDFGLTTDGNGKQLFTVQIIRTMTIKELSSTGGRLRLGYKLFEMSF